MFLRFCVCYNFFFFFFFMSVNVWQTFFLQHVSLLFWVCNQFLILIALKLQLFLFVFLLTLASFFFFFCLASCLWLLFFVRSALTGVFIGSTWTFDCAVSSWVSLDTWIALITFWWVIILFHCFCFCFLLFFFSFCTFFNVFRFSLYLINFIFC